MVEATFQNFPPLFSHLIKKASRTSGCYKLKSVALDGARSQKELNVGNYWHYVTLFWEVLRTHVPLFLEGQRSGVLFRWPQTKYNLKGWNGPRKGGAAVIWTFLSHDLGLKICKTKQVFFFFFFHSGTKRPGLTSLMRLKWAFVTGCIHKILVITRKFFFLMDTNQVHIDVTLLRFIAQQSKDHSTQFEAAAIFCSTIVIKQILSMFFGRIQKLPLTYLQIHFSAAVIAAHRETRRWNKTRSRAAKATDNRPSVYVLRDVRE